MEDNWKTYKSDLGPGTSVVLDDGNDGTPFMYTIIADIIRKRVKPRIDLNTSEPISIICLEGTSQRETLTAVLRRMGIDLNTLKALKLLNFSDVDLCMTNTVDVTSVENKLVVILGHLNLLGSVAEYTLGSVMNFLLEIEKKSSLLLLHCNLRGHFGSSLGKWLVHRSRLTILVRLPLTQPSPSQPAHGEFCLIEDSSDVDNCGGDDFNVENINKGTIDKERYFLNIFKTNETTLLYVRTRFTESLAL